jgi:hypothetical protein
MTGGCEEDVLTSLGSKLLTGSLATGGLQMMLAMIKDEVKWRCVRVVV